MADVFIVLSDISPAIKLGWVVFAVWSTAQVIWYQRARASAAVPVKAARKRKSQSSARRPVARTSRSHAAGADNGADLLASLGFQTPGASQYGVPMSSGQIGPTVIS